MCPACFFGGVHEVHAEFDGAAQEAFTSAPVGEGTEISRLSAEPHRAVADAVHGQLAAGEEGEHCARGGVRALAEAQLLHVGDAAGVEDVHDALVARFGVGPDDHGILGRCLHAFSEK